MGVIIGLVVIRTVQQAVLTRFNLSQMREVQDHIMLNTKCSSDSGGV